MSSDEISVSGKLAEEVVSSGLVRSLLLLDLRCHALRIGNGVETK